MDRYGWEDLLPFTKPTDLFGILEEMERQFEDIPNYVQNTVEDAVRSALQDSISDDFRLLMSRIYRARILKQSLAFRRTGRWDLSLDPVQRSAADVAEYGFKNYRALVRLD